MTYTKPVFITGEIYHLYNRGVNKQLIFKDQKDYRNMLIMFGYYLDNEVPLRLSEAKRTKRLEHILLQPPQKPLVEIVSYCLMPNHFHLLVKQITDKGVSTFMRRSLNSYSRYYNERHNRVGPMFQNSFRAIKVDTDEQLLQAIRYIHLNPFIAKLTKHLENYQWSSHHQYIAGHASRLCNSLFGLELIAQSGGTYQEFIQDYADYTRQIQQIKNILIEE